MRNEKWKITKGKWLVVVGIIIVAATFRLSVAHWLPNDTPDDGRVYAQIARNLLEQHVYSHETEAPYAPSLIRLPGYPLFLTAIYSVFGHTNNGAVRIIQALFDTGSCVLVALIAFYWQPDEKRKRATAIAALALAAVCPFTTIYAATILTEVPVTFLVLAMFLASTVAFRKTFTTEEKQGRSKRSLIWWLVAGFLGGLAVLFRPDSGLFLAAVGITLVATGVRSLWSAPAESRLVGSDGALECADLSALSKAAIRRRTPKQRSALPAPSMLSRAVVAGGVFSLAFVLVLVPWTIRNARVFHLFQPLSPAHGEMPGEFVPRGYTLWLRTWLDHTSYVAPFLWSLDDQPIDIEDIPPSAFDSAEEKDRVAALLDKYNHPDGSPEAGPSQSSSQPNSSTSPTPSPAPSPPKGKSTTLPATKATPGSTVKAQKNSNANQSANANTNSETEETVDENENDNSADQGDESDSEAESDQTEEDGSIEMTPEIDAGFAQLARERIARHPVRFYVWLPLTRAHTMWFDTHSQYWPFEGDLLPLEDLDYEHQQQFWLPLFAGLTGIYTLLGLAGAWLLWSSGEFAARRWLLLTMLAIVLRLVLFSSMENPEPRYLVEFFPFLAILGGIAIVYVPGLFKSDSN